MLYKSFLLSPPFLWYCTPCAIFLLRWRCLSSSRKWGMGYSETSASWDINRKSVMFRVGVAASLVLSTLGFIFICILTQSAHMPFLFFGSRSISFLLAPQLVLLDLQGHKHVATTDCDLLWLWFAVVLTAVCVSCVGPLVLSCVCTLPHCILICRQKVQFTHRATTCFYCKLKLN